MTQYPIQSIKDRDQVTVVITGGAGFIGSHLSERFIAEGYRVLCIDNLCTGNKKNIEPLMNHPRFRFMEHDVSTFIDLPADVGPVAAILHFASPASPIDYLKLPIQTLKVGSLGTHNALGLAVKHGARFLLASTSEVYGDPLIHPQSESYWGNVNPIGPRGVYDEAKRFAEAMVMAYHRVHKLDTKIVRIFNTYGPRMRLRDGRAIPAFLSQAITGEEMTVYGEGNQTRSFCYVTDLVEGIFRLLGSNFNEPVNLGNPQEMTILQLAEEIKKLTQTKSTIVYRDLPVDDPKVRKPNIARAKDLLQWEPKVGFQEGIAKTYQYFKQALQ